MIGLIGGAMQGAGQAGTQLVGKAADYLERSTLQQEMAEIQRLRDIRLAEVEKENLRYKDELQRAPGKRAAAAIKQASSTPVDDLSGTVRPRTDSELADARATAYADEGMVSEAQKEREMESTRQHRKEQGLIDRERLGVQARTSEDELAERRRHNQAIEKIQAATEGRIKAGAELDNAVKQIALDNANRLEKLRGEFSTADAKRKEAIENEIQVLTGKDSDHYLPVPLKDDMENITGYKIFDRKRGRWLDEGGAQGGAPAAGAVVDGYRFKGGNPRDRNNWEEVNANAGATKGTSLVDVPPGTPGLSLRERKARDIEKRKQEEEQAKREEEARQQRLRKPEYGDAGY